METPIQPDVPDASPVPGETPELLEERWITCVGCGARMESRKCKLVCARCGFFMSCSEFE